MNTYQESFRLQKINEAILPVLCADQLTDGLGTKTDTLKLFKAPKALSKESVDAYSASGLTYKAKVVAKSADHFNVEYTPKIAKKNAEDCHGFRHRIFSKHASLAMMLANGYKRLEKFAGYVEANKRLRCADEVLTLRDIRLSVDDIEICQIADDKSRHCLLKVNAKDLSYQTYQTLAAYVASYSLTAPKLDDDKYTLVTVRKPQETQILISALTGALNRMADTVWWRRQLRKKQFSVIEQLARDLRLVHKKASPYLSDFSVSAKRERKAANEAMMSKMYILNEGQDPFGDVDTLQDVVSRSSTSGKQQAAELMVRIRGTEDLAKMNGHSCEFYTFSAPSRFHSVLATGYPNKKYDGSSARDAQAYFNNIWKLARARFSKADLKPYGFRVVEPHHDGCPHWHMLLFMQKGQAKLVRKILKELCMRDTPEEVRTYTTRFKPVYIDPNKGSAAGYIAKYITKAVNGANVKEIIDPASGEIRIAPADAAERARFWASINNIRQFESIGLPSVTVWRQMRKLGKGLAGKCEVANAVNTHVDLVGGYALEKVREAADSSDWAAFCLAMGGVQIKRKDQVVRIHYQIPDIVDMITGEVSRIEGESPYFQTKYGDIPKGRTLGVAWDSVVIITRRAGLEVVSERGLKARQTIMRGACEFIDDWLERDLFLRPTDEEMWFLNECMIEDKLNRCFYMDAEALDSAFSNDEVMSLDLCH